MQTEEDAVVQLHAEAEAARQHSAVLRTKWTAKLEVSDWATCDARACMADLYDEHPDVRNRSPEECDEIRKENDIHILEGIHACVESRQELLFTHAYSLACSVLNCYCR